MLNKKTYLFKIIRRKSKIFRAMGIYFIIFVTLLAIFIAYNHYKQVRWRKNLKIGDTVRFKEEGINFLGKVKNKNNDKTIVIECELFAQKGFNRTIDKVYIP